MSNLKEWVEDRQVNGDDGTGYGEFSMSTCKVCSGDFDNESMIEDIQGAKYCLLDSGAICLVCGIYGHDCEGK